MSGRIEKKDIISDEAMSAIIEVKEHLNEIIRLKSIAFDGCCDKIKIDRLQES